MSKRSELFPSERLQQPPPATFPPEYREELSETAWELPATHAIELDGAQVNHEALVFSPWPERISFARSIDGTRFDRLGPRVRFAVKNYAMRRPRRAGRVMWCVDNLSPDNWYHWLTEVLPRVYAARSLFSSIDYLAFPAYYRRNAFVEQSLVLWPDLPRLLWISPRERVVGEPLVFIERAAPPWFYRSSVMRGMVDDMKARSVTDGSTTSEGLRLYLSRSDASWRRVANENEVRQLLESRGFATVVSGDLSVAEQVSLFSQATHIVGPHGAALANMVFQPGGGIVMELATRDPHRHWRCYYNLAYALKLRYAVIACDSVAPPTAGFEERRDADLVVDLDVLASALDRADVLPSPA